MAARRRPAALASVLLALVVTASACASDPPADAAPPNATMPPSTSSAPTPEPTTTSPPTTAQAPVDPVVAKIPKAARANTQEGAEAFAKFFIEQVAMSGVKADPTLIKGLYSASCKTCANFVATAQHFKDSGEHHQQPALTVESSTANKFVDEGKEIAVWVKQRAVDIVDSKGVRVGETKASRVAFVVFVTYERHWVVDAVQVERP